MNCLQANLEFKVWGGSICKGQDEQTLFCADVSLKVLRMTCDKKY